jgi:DNA-binding MarR family transcriptional regulator
VTVTTQTPVPPVGAPADAVDHAVEVLSALSGLIRTSRAAGRRLQDDLGASSTPLAVLKAVARRDGNDRPGDLAVAAGVAPSVVSRVLTRLEDEGLVTRRRDEVDARACHIVLTGAGESHLRRVQRETAAVLHDALVDLPAEDLARLPRLLTELERALAQATERLSHTRRASLSAPHAPPSDAAASEAHPFDPTPDESR